MEPTEIENQTSFWPNNFQSYTCIIPFPFPVFPFSKISSPSTPANIWASFTYYITFLSVTGFLRYSADGFERLLHILEVLYLQRSTLYVLQIKLIICMMDVCLTVTLMAAGLLLVSIELQRRLCKGRFGMLWAFCQIVSIGHRYFFQYMGVLLFSARLKKKQWKKAVFVHKRQPWYIIRGQLHRWYNLY